MSRSIAILLVLSAGCGEETQTAEVSPPMGEVSAPGLTPEAPVDPNAPARKAMVLETVDSGGYTYARLDSCGSEAWVAAPPTVLTVGQKVSLPAGMVLENFESKTLGRTFDAILFVSWIRTTEDEIDCTPPPPPVQPPMAMGRPPHGPGGPPGPVDPKSPGHGQPGGPPSLGGAPPPAAGNPFMSTGAPHGPPGTGGPGAARPQMPDDVQGKILETMTSGGYTYANLQKCDGSTTWVAGPQGNVAVGQTLGVSGSMPMSGFQSSSLGRSFDQILFAQAIRVVSDPKPCN